MNQRSFPTWSLTCGILSFVGFALLTSIPAWILGHQALKSRNELTPSEVSQAQVGKILGIIATIIGMIALVLAIVMTGFAMQLIEIVEQLVAGKP